MRKNSRVRGYAIAGSILEVHEVRQGRNCSRGWAVVDGGYLCLEETQWTTDTAASSSSFLEWEVPIPNENTETYRVTDWKPEESFEPLMPRVHARIADHSRGRLWASAEAYDVTFAEHWLPTILYRIEESAECAAADGAKQH